MKWGKVRFHLSLGSNHATQSTQQNRASALTYYTSDCPSHLGNWVSERKWAALWHTELSSLGAIQYFGLRRFYDSFDGTAESRTGSELERWWKTGQDWEMIITVTWEVPVSKGSDWAKSLTPSQWWLQYDLSAAVLGEYVDTSCKKVCLYIGWCGKSVFLVYVEVSCLILMSGNDSFSTVDQRGEDMTNAISTNSPDVVKVCAFTTSWFSPAVYRPLGYKFMQD